MTRHMCVELMGNRETRDPVEPLQVRVMMMKVLGKFPESPLMDSQAKQHEDMTLEDIYNKEGDNDDEDDSDWEPLEKRITIVRWFCVNCTMANIDDAIYCHKCGEHKESGILRHGFLASLLQEADSFQNTSLERNGRSEASCSRALAPHKSTAVGFDERMLLHSEVERKSLPHPERPDRLRAIVASLATAGLVYIIT